MMNRGYNLSCCSNRFELKILDITSIVNWMCITSSPFPGHTIPFHPQLLSVELTHKVASTIRLKIKAKVATTIRTKSNVLQILSVNCRS